MAKLHQNTILFSHTDLDGIGGGILFKAALGYEAEVYYCNYGSVDETINKVLDNIEKYALPNEYPYILIADLGIAPETAERLDRYVGGKRWLDHHKTNIELASKYDWATIDVERSGTKLVFDEYENIPRKYEDFANHVNDYDLWIHELEKSNDLNRLLYIVGINRFEDRFLQDERVEFNSSETLLLELEEEKIELYADRVEKGLTVHYLEGDKRIGIGFAERYQSEIAHDLIARNNLDAIALIDVNYRKISFRSKPNFDVGSIAKELGGGGHKNAAGVEFNYGYVSDFHGSKYPLYGVYDSLKRLVFELYWKTSRAYESLENKAIKELFKGAN